MSTGIRCTDLGTGLVKGPIASGLKNVVAGGLEKLYHHWLLLRGTQFAYTKIIEGVYFKQMNLILYKLCLSKVIYKEHSSCDCLSRRSTLWNQKSLQLL